MMYSRHYTNDRVKRANVIAEVGEGTVVYTTIIFDEKRKRNYKYEITDNAVLIVKATDVEMVITKMLARPSRIKKVWADAPKEIIEKAIIYSRNAKYYA